MSNHVKAAEAKAFELACGSPETNCTYAGLITVLEAYHGGAEKKNYPKAPEWVPAAHEWMVYDPAESYSAKHSAFLCTRIKDCGSPFPQKYFYHQDGEKESYFLCLASSMRKATPEEISTVIGKAIGKAACPERIEDVEPESQKEWVPKVGDKVHYCLDKGGTCHLEIIGIVGELTVPGSLPERIRFNGVSDSYSLEYCTLLEAAPKG